MWFAPVLEKNLMNKKKLDDMLQFPVVGIGASAGGPAAFEGFFSGMRTLMEPDMAFVLVQYPVPDYRNILTGFIQRYTSLQVFEVEDRMEVRVNCAYVNPPALDMAFVNGRLYLSEPSPWGGHHLLIDNFFTSLARDQQQRAICIVLSGNGSDGTSGVRAIKDEGGMAMAQACGTAEYDGMPCSAIATGLVDYQLPPAEMPARLMAYVAEGFGKPLKRRRQEAGRDHRAGFGGHPDSPAGVNGSKLQFVDRGLGLGKLSLRELTERTLLKLTAPTGALVTVHGDILYLHGRAGMYLEQVPNEAGTNNILKMAREGLRRELTTALHKATISGEIYRRKGLRVKSDGAFVTVNLTVSPVVTGPASITDAPLYLIIIEEVVLQSNESWDD